MQQLSEAQRLVRTAPKKEISKARQALTKMEHHLTVLPKKFEKMEAEQRAKIEAQRKLLEQLERAEQEKENAK